jgi:hypothetical protein
MATLKTINAGDIKTSTSVLNQLVDVIQEDISGSATRQKYQVFVTGGVGPGVTSSLFQTVYDQDYTLQTSNAILDLGIGIYSGSTYCHSASTGVDTSGKVLYMSESLMMREKVAFYRQQCQTLTGDADGKFKSPFDSSTTSDEINIGLFLNVKRLFARDSIKKETFAMRIYRSGTNADIATDGSQNIYKTSESGSCIITDVGSSTNIYTTTGGTVGNLVNSANTTENLGLIFYQSGVVVLDVEKVISGAQRCSGSINSVTAASVDGQSGRVCLGDRTGLTTAGTNKDAKFIPDFIVSASMDAIIDHFASCRLQSGSQTALTFQNNTQINSSLIFCRATADEFNYSSNPTYVDRTTNKINVIEEGNESSQKAFSYITTVGLFDDNDNLIATAKMSRPIEKNDEKDITIRVRLDF